SGERAFTASSQKCLPQRLLCGRPMRKLIAACVVLAAASLLLPSEPSYDPLAGLIWGRELAHFRLDTAGGPSWKPLPVLVTALLAPFGAVDHELPATLWMLIARTGALL